MPVVSAPSATWTALLALIRLEKTIGLATCPGLGLVYRYLLSCPSATVLAVPPTFIWGMAVGLSRRQKGLFQAETRAASRPPSPASTRAQDPRAAYRR